MSVYAVEHASALADVAEAGAAVTFTRTSPGTYDPATETYSSPTTTTVAGSAIRVSGNPDRYRALELIASKSPTLLFTPTTLGSLPALGDSVSWGGVAYSTKDIEPLDLDGAGAILAYIVVGA